MAKLTQNFSFSYPLKQKVVRDLKIVTEHIGELQVEGVGHLDTSASRLDIFDRFSVDITKVSFNGTDIKPVLDANIGMDQVIDETIRQVAKLMEQKEVPTC